MFKCFPDDPKILQMDIITKQWMFYSWLQDEEDRMQEIKYHGCLIGSFTNADAAKKIMGNEENRFESSEKDFDLANKYVDNYVKKKSKKRKKIIFK